MTDQTEAMDNLIAQDADLIEICPDDLVQRLREMGEHPCRADFPIGADLREAADRIESQAAEIEWLRVEVKAQYDRGYYDGYTHPLERSK